MKGFNRSLLFFKLLFPGTILFLCAGFSFAQPGLPPRTITVTATQALNFGRVCVTGMGGTVTVGWDGSRTSTGGVVIISTPAAQPAIFEIKLCQGRNVSITYLATTILTGSNGGSLTLDLGPTEYGGNNASFPTKGDCSYITPMRMGGTLHIPGTAFPGTYTGTFDITFNQQ
jgi:hypothetical protein